MAYLYADFYEKKYKAPIFSLISFVWLFFLLLAIIAPYYICYATRGKTQCIQP